MLETARSSVLLAMKFLLSHSSLLSLALTVATALFLANTLWGESIRGPFQQSDQLLADTQWAICYSGFRSGQHPDRGQGAKNPSDAEILEDLKILQDEAGFTLIRLYDAQVNSAAVLRLIQAHQLEIKVLLGAWLDAEVNNPNCPWLLEPHSESTLAANTAKNQAEIARAITLANQYPKIVAAVAVGNEALVDWNDHMVPLAAVLSYVREVQEAVVQPVTVADNYRWWAESGAELAAAVDFVSVHVYPIWEERDIDTALAYTIQNLQQVRAALPQSQLVITEAGWASTASEFGPRASEEKQKRYYEELRTWTAAQNITTFFFEAFDEEWKGDPGNPHGAEKHWGLFTVERKPKLVFKDPSQSSASKEGSLKPTDSPKTN